MKQVLFATALMLFASTATFAAEPGTTSTKSPSSTDTLTTTMPGDAVTVTNWYKQNVYDSSDNKIGEIVDVLMNKGGIPASCSFRIAMICSSVCRFRFIVWSFPVDQTPGRLGSIQGGNVIGSIISFRVGAEDAPYLVREFNGRFGEIDLLQLPNYRIYLKLMIDGTPSTPFSAVTLTPASLS